MIQSESELMQEQIELYIEKRTPVEAVGRKAILVSRQQGYLIRLIDTLIGRPIFLSDLEKEI